MRWIRRQDVYRGPVAVMQLLGGTRKLACLNGLEGDDFWKRVTIPVGGSLLLLGPE